MKKIFIFSVLLLPLSTIVYGDDSSNPNDWFRISHSDLQLAQMAFQNGIAYENVCFLSHQSLEKMLKGFYYLNNNVPPRSHRLAELARDLKDFQIMDTPEWNDLKKIDEIYIPSRYPTKEDSRFSEDKAHSCLIIAENFHQRYHQVYKEVA